MLNSSDTLPILKIGVISVRARDDSRLALGQVEVKSFDMSLVALTGDSVRSSSVLHAAPNHSNAMSTTP